MTLSIAQPPRSGGGCAARHDTSGADQPHAIAAYPSRTLGYAGLQSAAPRNRALLTRSDLVSEVMRFTFSVLIQRATRRAETMSEDPVARITDVIAFAAPTSEQERRENIALVEYRVMGRTDPDIAADVAATSLAGSEVIRSLLRDALADRVIDEESLHREALLLFTLVEGFSFSSALFSAPLRETDVRAVVTSTMHRLRDAYPPFEETAAAAASALTTNVHRVGDTPGSVPDRRGG